MSNLLNKFLEIRAFTQSLCQPLQTEDYVPQAAEFASPPKWHLAHTTWFFEEMILSKYRESYRPFHPDFSFLFNSYYQAIGERAQRNQRGLITRPTVKEVYEYREYVDKHMVLLLRELEGTGQTEPEQLVVLGLNHEQQHQELLLSDLKYNLSANPIHPVYKPQFSLVNRKNKSEGWLSMKEGLYTIGYKGNGFHFDNEQGQHQVFLSPFRISKRMVTNGEYLEFIEDGGYQNFKHWLDEGWTWAQQNHIQHPLYWIKKEQEWFHYTLGGLVPVDPDAILSHVSFYEASAYAQWRGMRLPTEFEWESAADQLDWGDCWEWTNSAYLPYPGFKIAEGAVGEYNGKFMVNQLVLRGASTATSPGHSRKTYRNFFHPQLRWQFAGIRLAQ